MNKIEKQLRKDIWVYKMSELEKRKMLLEFIGFKESQKAFDPAIAHINSYYVLFRKETDFEILINKKGDGRCNIPWNPSKDWNALFLIIDKISKLLNSGYNVFFEIIPEAHAIEEVYNEAILWVADYLERIERMKQNQNR